MVYNGDPMTWRIFYESFRRTIHENPDLTDHERIQYLINKLSGRALAVCSGIVPNGDNYSLIWQTLVDKYNDKRSLASAYLDQMLDFKPLTTTSSKNLELFLDRFCTAVSSLNSLELKDVSDFILLQLALKKIDSNTARLFEMHMRGKSMPTYNDELITFIREQSKILERTTPTSNNRTYDNKQVSAKSTHSLTASCVSHCPLCKQTDHIHLYRCPAFNKLSIEDRFDFIKNKNGCTNCLSVSHFYTACLSKFNCRVCGCKHHSMLCRKASSPRDDTPAQPTSAPRPPARLPRARSTGDCDAAAATGTAIRAHLASRAPQPADDVERFTSSANAMNNPQQNVSLCNNSSISQSHNTTCLLGTVQVYATDLNGRRHVVRALIDSASQSNFITSNCSSKLNLKCNKVPNTVVKGIGSASNPIKGAVSISLSSRINDNFISIDAYVIDRITDNLPSVQVDVSCLSYLRYLPLADENFSSPSEIDVLIGAPLFSEILLSGRAAGPPGTPTAFETIFGYTVIGTAPVTTAPVSATDSIDDPCVVDSFHSPISLCTFTDAPRLDNIVQESWQLEEVLHSPSLSPSNFEIVQNFNKTLFRDTSGRYSVTLPFALDSAAALGNSYPTDKNQFMHLDRKPVASPPLRAEYDATLKQCLQNRYISLVNNDNNDCKYTNILYRSVLSSPTDTHQFNRDCLGLSSSVFLTMRVPHLLCDNERARFPNASTAISESSTCLSDVCQSMTSPIERDQLRNNLRELLTAGGFEPVEGTSNAPGPTESLPVLDRHATNITFDEPDVNSLVNSYEFYTHSSAKLSANRIDPKINTPQNPHFGGNHENKIRAFKGRLHKTVRSQLITYKKLLTVLTQLESLTNPRPLTLLSEELFKHTALTPAHFMINAPLNHLPACTVFNKPAHTLQRQKLPKRLIQLSSKRRKPEHLHLPQSRGKRNTSFNPTAQTATGVYNRPVVVRLRVVPAQ